MQHDSRSWRCSEPDLFLRKVQRFLANLLDGDMHAKRVLSLANATLGVIGRPHPSIRSTRSNGGPFALQRAALVTKHAIKQVDRLLSNEGIDIDARAAPLGALCGGTSHQHQRRHGLDPDFDADGQATIYAIVADPPRPRYAAAVRLYTVTTTATLKNHRNEYEYQVLVRLADALPADIKVCIVADRGFGDQKLYRVLTEQLKYDYVIRFRGNIAVTAANGEVRTAAAWVGPGGRARVLRGALVTAERYQVGTVLCVQEKDMKQAWCLATSSTEATARALMTLYGKRWGIECGLRDTKDLRFGMGMGSIHVSTPARRDRLWLLNAFAIVLLTLLGAAKRKCAALTAFSNQIPPNTARILCFAKAACFTNSFPPCRNCACFRWSSGSPQCSPNFRSLPILSVRYRNEGSHEGPRANIV